jgi:hypothetical protein
VFELLGMAEANWTRHLDLVAANDRGYIEGRNLTDMLVEAGVPEERIHDRRLRWGAKASDYSDEIHQSLAAGERTIRSGALQTRDLRRAAAGPVGREEVGAAETAEAEEVARERVAEHHFMKDDEA